MQRNIRPGFILLILFLLSTFLSVVHADIQSARDAYANENYETAFKEFQTLAESGNTEAQAKLGAMYFWGLGTAKDDALAYRWGLMAAKANNADAQNLIGYMYENGIDTSKNIQTAIDWYSKSANQNHSAAQANLAGIFLLSDDYPHDIERGLKLAKKAAEQGNAHGQYLIGYVNLTVKNNIEQAIDELTKSAELGSYEAAGLLGKLYFNGEQIGQDRPKAYFWFTIADLLGEPQASDYLARVKSYLSETEINTLDEDANRWLADRR